MTTKDNPLGFVKPLTTSATPDVPVAIPTSLGNSVKVATPDLIEFNDASIPIEFMTDLMFENIGGQEILSVSRNDTVNGQKVLYSPIKNIAQVSTNYNPQNLFVITDTSSSYFNNYSINLQERVPEIGSNSAANEVPEIIYMDDNGDIVVNVINMRINDQVEISVVDNITQLGDILY